MSGTIIIAEKNMLDMNTLAFDHIVEKVRPHFDSFNSPAMNRAYEPMDQGGMTFIDLSEASQNDFRDFCRATTQAKLMCSQNAPTPYDVWWDRLWALLSKDPRFDA